MLTRYGVKDGVKDGEKDGVKDSVKDGVKDGVKEIWYKLVLLVLPKKLTKIDYKKWFWLQETWSLDISS